MTTSIDMPLVAMVVSILLLGVAALGWGVDSRPTLSDDHRR
jgi:hypothetical protein